MVANYLLCVSKLGHTGRSGSFFPTASGHYLYVHARYVADWFSCSRAIGSGDSNKQGLAGELKRVTSAVQLHWTKSIEVSRSGWA